MKNNKIFSYKDCTFAVEKEKENTARIVVYKELGVVNWYTLESTFYGSDALAKVVYEESSSEEDEIESEGDSEDAQLEARVNSKPLNEQSDEVQDIRPLNSQDHQELHCNNMEEVKLPSLIKLESAKFQNLDEASNIRVKKQSKSKKARLVGDIHINQKHLLQLGSDLCKTMFSFYNDSIKIRKLNQLRKLSKD